MVLFIAYSSLVLHQHWAYTHYCWGVTAWMISSRCDERKPGKIPEMAFVSPRQVVHSNQILSSGNKKENLYVLILVELPMTDPGLLIPELTLTEPSVHGPTFPGPSVSVLTLPGPSVPGPSLLGPSVLDH